MRTLFHCLPHIQSLILCANISRFHFFTLLLCIKWHSWKHQFRFPWRQLACRWVITTSAHQNIRLNFTFFQLSDDASIKVYNGNSEKSYLLGTFTGTRHRFVVHTNNRFMLVKLTKEYSDSLCKFEAVFTSSTSKGKLWYTLIHKWAARAIMACPIMALGSS